MPRSFRQKVEDEISSFDGALVPMDENHAMEHVDFKRESSASPFSDHRRDSDGRAFTTSDPRLADHRIGKRRFKAGRNACRVLHEIILWNSDPSFAMPASSVVDVGDRESVIIAREFARCSRECHKMPFNHGPLRILSLLLSPRVTAKA